MHPKSTLPSRLGPPKSHPNFGLSSNAATRPEEPSELPYAVNTILIPLLEELTLRLLEIDESRVTKVKDLSRFINMIIHRTQDVHIPVRVFATRDVAFLNSDISSLFSLLL
jgi:hypothetical protein